jgi:hypothetical protein
MRQRQEALIAGFPAASKEKLAEEKPAGASLLPANDVG